MMRHNRHQTMPLLMLEDPIHNLFLAVFLASIVFGAVARKTQFCPLGGVADVMHSGHTGRLRMYLFAIAIAILGVTLLEGLQWLNLDTTRPPYRMSLFRWPGYLLGGMLFGIGMTLCRGCGMKNVLNLGGGDLKALAAIAGMGTAAVFLLYVEGSFETLFLSWITPLTPDLAVSGFDYQDLGTVVGGLLGVDVHSARMVIGSLLGAALLVFVFKSADFRERRDNLIGGLVIGGLIVGVFYLSAGALGESAQEASDFMDQPQNGMGIQSYTFIRPMGDLFYVASNPLFYLVTFGLVAFLGVGAGSILVSLVTRSFRWQWFASWPEFLRFLGGGILVGVGGILGMGCTLGQGLAGTSTLAMGSFVDLAALLAGAWLGIRIQPRFMDDHVVPVADTLRISS